jgi:hypothetical protein
LTETKGGIAGLAGIGILFVGVATILAMVLKRRRNPDFHSLDVFEFPEYDDFYDAPSIEDERTYSSKKLVLNVV